MPGQMSTQNGERGSKGYERLREFEKDDLLAIHRESSRAGGAWSVDVRDEGSLDFMLWRFRYMVGREDDMFSIAAFVMHFIVAKHVFWDVSHRTGFEVARVILRAFDLNVDAIHDEVVEFVKSIDSKNLSVKDVENWLKDKAK